MEQSEVLEGNRLIAEFMGVKIGEDKYSWRPGVQEPLQEYHLAYHTSWGWIMPVVEKIESIYDDFNGYFGIYIHSNVCTIQGTKLDSRPESLYPAYLPDANAVFASKIESTWYNVVQFIKWYNSQPVKPI